MTAANSSVSYGEILAKKIHEDFDSLTPKLSTFIDQFIIKDKWNQGFPGHELQKSTIRRKGGNSTVGEKTGKLKAAATAFSSWEFRKMAVGGIRPVLTKRKHGLTAYAHLVKTRVGGELDFLGLSASDIVRIERYVASELRPKGYIGSWKIRHLKK